MVYQYITWNPRKTMTAWFSFAQVLNFLDTEVQLLGNIYVYTYIYTQGFVFVFIFVFVFLVRRRLFAFETMKFRRPNNVF